MSDKMEDKAGHLPGALEPVGTLAQSPERPGGVPLSGTVCERDLADKPPGMDSRRVPESGTPPGPAPGSDFRKTSNGPLLRGASLVWLAVIAVAGLAHLLPEAAREWLLYDRGAIAAGQYWRLLSGHFLHTNLNHFLVNVAALAILCYMFAPYLSARKAAGILLLLCVLCGAGLFAFAGDLQRYVGLSGVLHGLVVWGSVVDIRRGERLGLVLLLGTAAKIAWEQLGGDTSATAALIDADVAIAAHLWGAVAGLLIALVVASWQACRGSRTTRQSAQVAIFEDN